MIYLVRKALNNNVKKDGTEIFFFELAYYNL